MIELGNLLYLAQIDAQRRARENGREATSEEIEAEMQKAWDRHINARVESDMARFGFVKTDQGWRKPRRGLFALLFGR